MAQRLGAVGGHLSAGFRLGQSDASPNLLVTALGPAQRLGAPLPSLQGTACARGQLHCRDTAETGRRRVGPIHANLSAKTPPALPCQACLARRRRRDVGSRQRGRRLRVRTGTGDAPPPTHTRPPRPWGEGGRARRLHGQCYIAVIDDGLVRSDGGSAGSALALRPSRSSAGRQETQIRRPGRSAPPRYRRVLPRPQRLDCSGAGQRAPPPHRGRGQGAGRARHATGQPRLGRAVTRRRRD